MSGSLGAVVILAGIAMGFVGVQRSGSDIPSEQRSADLWCDFGVIFVVVGALVLASAALAALRGGT